MLEPSWVPARTGMHLPNGAAVSCTNFNGPICIGRANHNGFTLPGKVVPGKYCTLSWHGKAVIKHEYEVLCNAGEMWQMMNAGCPIPQSALPIGHTDHEGILFVGRVHRNGGVTIVGKVTSKDSMCYVYLNAEKAEVGFTEFEILTVPPGSYYILTKMNNPGMQMGGNNTIPMPLSFNQNPPYCIQPPNCFGMNNNGLNSNQIFVNKNFQQNQNHQNNGAIRKNKNNYQNKKNKNNLKDGFVGKKQGAGKVKEMNQENEKELLDQEQSVSKPKIQKKQDTKRSSCECCHLGEIADLSLECLDRHSACDKCDNKGGDNWECLSCRKVFCRDVDQHMMVHAVQTSHYVVISQDDLSVWCFKCEVTLTAQNIIKVLSDRKKRSESVESKESEMVDKSPSPGISGDYSTSSTSDQEMPTVKEAIKIEDSFSWLKMLFSWPQVGGIPSVDKGQEVDDVQSVPLAEPLPAVSVSDQATSPKKKPCWVACNDNKVPVGALSGGQTHLGVVFVARAEHMGALIPAKFDPNYSGCYTSFNGTELWKTKFEILCHVDAKWVKMTNALPGKAVQGGYNEEKMPLYIGRFLQSDDTAILGKVEQIDGEFKLIYMMSRQEKQTSDFEILISLEPVPLQAKITASHTQYAGHRASASAGRWASASTDHRAPSSAGHRASSSADHRASASAGHRASSSAGHRASASAGHRASASADHRASASAGHRASVSAGRWALTSVAQENKPTNSPSPLQTAPNKASTWIKWVKTRDGAVPAGAVVGGKNHIGEVYVARAEHGGQLIVGKLIPQFNLCYIAFQGSEIRKKEYEILCDANNKWVPMTSGGGIPSTAIPAGILRGKTLYIGRVCSGVDRVTIGQVDNQGQMTALQNGNVLQFTMFDILVSTVHDLSVLSKVADKLSSILANFKLHTPQPATQQAAPPFKKKEEVFRMTPLLTTDREYIYVEKKMQNTIKTHSGMFGGGSFTRYNISKIEKIFNTVLFYQYRHSCDKIKRENNGDVNEKQLFHGSSKCTDIAKKGFDERHASRNGMFGAGVYFAEHSSKSNQYTGGTGNMLMCKVALGKIAEHTTANNSLAHAPPGHHSVKGTPGGALNYPEYIVYRGDQALPTYLITYTTS